MARLLAGDDPIANVFFVPALRDLCGELGREISVSGVDGKVGSLEGVDGHVVELCRVGRAVDVLVWSPPDHEHRVRRHLTRVLAERLVDGVEFARPRWHQASAGEVVVRLLSACDVEQRGQQVEVRARVRDLGVGHARAGDHQGHPCRPFVERHLEPRATVAQHVAVVAGNDHDGVVGPTGLFQGGEQFA